MKTKQVTRYICDFCGKTGYSLGCMRRHEVHCTLNPKRECRMCEAAQECAPTPEELATVVALVPKLSDYERDGVEGINGGKCIDIDQAVAELRLVWSEIADRLHGCPACIMATLRQAGFPLALANSWWTYTEACAAWWKPINEDKRTYNDCC
jgi:hypothetical protein